MYKKKKIINYCMPKTKWESALEILGTSPDFLSDIRVRQLKGGKGTYPYVLVLNANREKRDEFMLEDKKASTYDTKCPMCIIHQYKPNAILGQSSSDYEIFPNKFPMVKNHSLAVRNIHNPNGSDPRVVTENELRQLSQIAKDQNSTLVHNTPYGGMSISDHEHTHLFPIKGFIDQSGKEYSFEPQIGFTKSKFGDPFYRIDHYPFDALAIAKDSHEAFSLTEKIQTQFINQDVIASFGANQDFIYFFPRGVEYSYSSCKKDKKNIPALREPSGVQGVGSLKDFNSLTHTDMQLQFARILPLKGEFDWKSIIDSLD